jgi:FkbM family methyltransferase
MRRLLTRLSRHLQGFSHQQALARLKNAFGFTPGTIYDIGAYYGNWTKLARRIYPSARYFLFEANPEHASILQSTGERYFIAALAEKDGARADFYTPRNAGATGASFFREQTIHYQGESLRVVPLATRRLDVLVKEHGLPSPDLIKLDVQGSEVAVLRGAGEFLDTCSAIVAELSFVQGNEGAPQASEVMTRIHEFGFEPVDICKVRRGAAGNPVQVDMLFVNSSLYRKYWTAAGLM